jgi:Protein of unknown function (DUF3551)
MREFLKLGVPAAMFVVAASVGALTANAAHAGEYCRTDVTGHMTSCPYDTMEQCHMTAQGMGGDCFRDPHLPANANSAGDNGNRGAYAYAPNGSRRTHRARSAQQQ